MWTCHEAITNNIFDSIEPLHLIEFRFKHALFRPELGSQQLLLDSSHKSEPLPRGIAVWLKLAGRGWKNNLIIFEKSNSSILTGLKVRFMRLRGVQPLYSGCEDSKIGPRIES